MRFVLVFNLLRKSRSVKIGILFFYRLKGSRYKEIIQRKTINFSRKRKKIKNYIFFSFILKGRLTNPTHLPTYFLPYVRKYSRSCQSSLIILTSFGRFSVTKISIISLRKIQNIHISLISVGA